MQFKDSFQKLIDDAKQEMTKGSALAIINEHMGQPVKSKNKKQELSIVKSPISKKIELIPPHQLHFIKYLYDQKFPQLNRSTKSIETYEEFAFRIHTKNKINSYLDLSNLNMTINNHTVLNKQLLKYNRVDFSTILINFNKLNNLFHDNLAQIVLNNCALTNQSINYIFKNLQKTNITKIDLSSKQLDKKNRLTDTSQLYELILNSSTLSILELSDIGLSEENCSDIFQHIKNSTVISLNLSKSLQLLGVTKQLQILKLNNNKIKTLKTVNFKECSFQLLDLSCNKLQIRNMESLFKNQILNIIDLVLDQNPIGNIDLLEKYLCQKAHIKGLSLRKCYLSDDSIRALFHGIENNSHLEKLNISMNSVSQNSSKIITQALNKIKLKVLNLSQCQITDEAGESLVKQLVNNKRLKNINLSQNRLSHLTGAALILSLRANRSLIQLNIKQNIIPYKFAKQIDSWIEYNNYSIKDNPKKITTVSTQQDFDGYQQDEVNIQLLSQLQDQLTKDVERLSAEHTKLNKNKQMYDELQEVFKIIDDNGSEKINNLMDQLDGIQEQINQQKQMKNEIARKSLTPSSSM